VVAAIALATVAIVIGTRLALGIVLADSLAALLRRYRLHVGLLVEGGDDRRDGLFGLLSLVLLLRARAFFLAGRTAALALVTTATARTVLCLRLVAERGQVTVEPFDLVADHLLDRVERLGVGLGDDGE